MLNTAVGADTLGNLNDDLFIRTVHIFLIYVPGIIYLDNFNLISYFFQFFNIFFRTMFIYELILLINDLCHRGVH